MDFYVDLAVAVVLRLLKERTNMEKYRRAMQKVYDAIGQAYGVRDGQLLPVDERRKS